MLNYLKLEPRKTSMQNPKKGTGIVSGANVEIGKDVSIWNYVVIGDGTKIGDDTLIGSFVDLGKNVSSPATWRFSAAAPRPSPRPPMTS